MKIFDLFQVIEGCRRQEPACQKILYERFFGYALKIAFRYVYQYHAAIDITNDGFVKVFRHMDRLRYEQGARPEGLFMAWLKRIVINTAIDELRKNKMTPEIGGIPEWVWEEADQSQRADQRLLYKELIGYIKCLPPVYRIVFNMYAIDGCTHLEIANHFGISEGTSRSNLSRARVILQKMISENEHSASVRRIAV